MPHIAVSMLPGRNREAKQDSTGLPVEQGDDRNIMLNAESAHADIVESQPYLSSRRTGADLYTAEDARDMEGRILSGTYLRPFTVEFGVKYQF